MDAFAYPPRCGPILMGKNSSNRLQTFFARLVKGLMVAIVLPIAIGLFQGILQQIDRVSVAGVAYHDWIARGFVTYVWLHLLLYRPAALFRISHRMFSVLAIWLFGGQVASVEQSGSGSAKGRSAKGERSEGIAQGSPLVAFSPYVIPLYTILVCAVAWILTRWWDRAFVDGPITFLIGVTSAFHWIMTADELQQQRSRWHVETYLLALGLVFIVTLLVGALCLPWAIPEFSFIQALADGLSNAHAIYATVCQRVFL